MPVSAVALNMAAGVAKAARPGPRLAPAAKVDSEARTTKVARALEASRAAVSREWDQASRARDLRLAVVVVPVLLVLPVLPVLPVPPVVHRWVRCLAT
jgi:hypothetical protein